MWTRARQLWATVAHRTFSLWLRGRFWLQHTHHHLNQVCVLSASGHHTGTIPSCPAASVCTTARPPDSNSHTSEEKPALSHDSRSEQEASEEMGAAGGRSQTVFSIKAAAYLKISSSTHTHTHTRRLRPHILKCNFRPGGSSRWRRREGGRVGEW